MLNEQPYQPHHYHYEQNSHHHHGASAQEKAGLLDGYCGPGNGAGPRLTNDDCSLEISLAGALQ